MYGYGVHEALHHNREIFVGSLGVRVGPIWLYTKNELDLRFIMISQQTQNLYFMLVWIVTNCISNISSSNGKK